MSELIVSVSGIRGEIGINLTPEIAIKFAQAFGTYIKGNKKVIIGSDTRITGDMMMNAVIAGLLGTGCQVINVGIAPTPTVQYLVKSLKADGGIVISASHNPIEWNALKLYKKGGILLNKNEGEAINNLFNTGSFKFVTWKKYQSLTYKPELTSHHVEKVLATLHNINKIKKRKFKIALDSCNASGSYITPELLKKLNCTVKGLYIKPDGYFPHNPEPNTKNLKKMMAFTKNSRVHIGFVQDSDADRLAILDEKGNFLSEEYTTALAVFYILSIYNKSKKLQTYSKSVVVNLSTSRMIDDVAKMFNAKVHRTAVGEINVVEKLIRSKSVIGGEGNGGVIFPPVNYGRDSLAGIGLILDCMACYNEPLSSLLKKIPSYTMLKTKFNIKGLNSRKILTRIKNACSKEKINTVDGLKVDFPDYWFHIRLSNTEPILRLIIEAKSKKILNQVYNGLIQYIK